MSYKLTDNSKVVISAKNAAIIRALTKIGMTATAYAKLKCPVDTGRLRASLHFEVTSEDEVTIGTDVKYGKYVEFGTHKQRSQPYLAPAVKDHIPQYKQIALAELRK